VEWLFVLLAFFAVGEGEKKERGGKGLSKSIFGPADVQASFKKGKKKEEGKGEGGEKKTRGE